MSQILFDQYAVCANRLVIARIPRSLKEALRKGASVAVRNLVGVGNAQPASSRSHKSSKARVRIVVLLHPKDRVVPWLPLAVARAIAKEAYVYGFPVVDSYRILYSSFVDRGNRRPGNSDAFFSAIRVAAGAIASPTATQIGKVQR